MLSPRADWCSASNQDGYNEDVAHPIDMMSEETENYRSQESVTVNATEKEYELHPPSRESRAVVSARLFSLAIVIYFIGCVAGLLFVSRVFGVERAVGLSMIAICPIIVAARMRLRWPFAMKREFTLLALLFIVATGSSFGLVQSWYHSDMDLKPEDKVFAEFGRALHKDPSFRGITVSPRKVKATYFVTGAVATKADLQRLEALANGFGITGQRPLHKQLYHCWMHIEMRANRSRRQPPFSGE